MITKSTPSDDLGDEARIPLQPGTEIDHYVLDKVLGVGGFGITYLAHHQRLQKRFAIKEYFPSDFSYRQGTSVRPTGSGNTTYRWGLERFLAEGRALARFKHPSIVDVINIFEANDTAYIVLAFETGVSLREWARSLTTPPTQDEIDRIVAPLLEALEVIHAARLLHRDIAPDNILLREDGSPVLIDFGSAREDIRAASHAMSVIVKRGYSPAEQYTSNALYQGPWTDIYALAATLYMLIAGQKPTDATDRMIIDTLAPAAAVARAEYRRAFLDGIDHGLALKAIDRPQTVSEWRDELLAGQGRNFTSAKTNRPDLSALHDDTEDQPETGRTRIGMSDTLGSALKGATAGAVTGLLTSFVASSILDPMCFADTCLFRYSAPLVIVGTLAGAGIGLLSGRQK